MVTDLEQALRDLGEWLNYPEALDLPDIVSERLRAEAPGRPPAVPARRILALAAAAVLLVGGAAVAARFSLRGVDVRTLPLPLPTTAGPVPFDTDLGESVSLARARAAVPFDVRLPGALGAPDSIHLDTSVPDGRVTILYRPGLDLPPDRRAGLGALFTQFRGTLNDDLLVRKGTPEGAVVERVGVGDAPGLWLTGEAHVVFLLDAEGKIREETIRLAGNVLLWQVGEVTYRLEADITLARAIAIARSVA